MVRLHFRGVVSLARASYMFNGVLCIHLYLLLLLLSAWRTDASNICSVLVAVTISMLFYLFRYFVFFLCLFRFVCYVCSGSTFNFLSPNRLLHSFSNRIYSHWIKSLLLLAINKYHSINIRNESNETAQTLSHFGNRFHSNAVPFIRYISFLWFAYFRIWCVLGFQLSSHVNWMNWMPNGNAIGIELGTHNVHPSDFLIC